MLIFLGAGRASTQDSWEESLHSQEPPFPNLRPSSPILDLPPACPNPDLPPACPQGVERFVMSPENVWYARYDAPV